LIARGRGMVGCRKPVIAARSAALQFNGLKNSPPPF
jgi:hypothetical protein